MRRTNRTRFNFGSVDGGPVEKKVFIYKDLKVSESQFTTSVSTEGRERV